MASSWALVSRMLVFHEMAQPEPIVMCWKQVTVEQSLTNDRLPISRRAPSCTNTRVPRWICTVPRTDSVAPRPRCTAHGAGVKWAKPRNRNEPSGMSSLDPGPILSRVPRETTHQPPYRTRRYSVRTMATCSATRRTTLRSGRSLLSGSRRDGNSRDSPAAAAGRSAFRSIRAGRGGCLGIESLELGTDRSPGIPRGAGPGGLGHPLAAPRFSGQALPDMHSQTPRIAFRYRAAASDIADGGTPPMLIRAP